MWKDGKLKVADNTNITTDNSDYKTANDPTTLLG